MRLLALLVAFACLAPRPARAAESKSPEWEALQFLVGEWIGEGGGQPGRATGEFSFTRELQGKVLVRRSRAEYPAIPERAAYVHADLMILYREPARNAVRAVYFDNEEHVIHYAVQAAADGSRIVLLSDAQPGMPRFRFTYTKVDAGTLRLKFEIATPGKAAEFSTYIEGLAKRKAP